MSSFSSVIQRPGKKITPKSVPRRNVARKPLSRVASTAIPSASLDSDPDQHHSLPTNPANSVSTDTQNTQSADPSEAQSTTPPPSDKVTTAVSATNSESQTLPLPSENLAASPRPDGEIDIPVQSPVSRVLQDVNEQSETLPSNVEPAVVQTNNSTSISDQEESPVLSGGTDVAPREQRVTIPDPSAPRPTRRRKVPDQEDAAPSPKKRRKTTPRATPGVLLSQPTAPTTSTESAIPDQPLSQRRNSRNQPTHDLLQSATQRAASVSELASDIESQTRLLRAQSEQLVMDKSESNPSSKRQTRPVTRNSKTKRTKRKNTAQEQAIEVVANALGNGSVSSRQRADTPEDAEDHEIEPAKVTMGELCEDSKLGKKSNLETEMQANWAEIVQRRKEDRERALLNAEKHQRKGVGQRSRILDNTQEAAVVLAPAMTVINGVIVVDQASREIDRSAQLQQAAAQDIDNVREDRDYYKYVNQGTVGIKPGRGQRSKWDEESNERFFKGLRMFGTDFLMIANMFPGVSRRQIKMKFIREENADKARVLDCLRNREPVQLEEYANMANKEAEEYQTLDSLQKELDEQEKRLREEDLQRRKKEGFISAETAENNADQTEPADAEGDAERQTASVEPGRFDSMAREIVGAAMAPKKRSRKANATTSKKGLKGGRRPDGGVEEVLGSIHEVAV